MAVRSPKPNPHSLLEVSLYIMLMPCRKCAGVFSVDPDGVRLEEETLSAVITCQKCHEKETLLFDTWGLELTEDVSSLPDISCTEAVNSTTSPSEMIDVTGWLTLHGMLLARAQGNQDVSRVRQLQIVARQCIEEALKFYEKENDLPPSDAFFDKHSLDTLQERPEFFTRERLLGLRSTLPSPKTPTSDAADERQKTQRKRWWTKPK